MIRAPRTAGLFLGTCLTRGRGAQTAAARRRQRHADLGAVARELVNRDTLSSVAASGPLQGRGGKFRQGISLQAELGL